MYGHDSIHVNVKFFALIFPFVFFKYICQDPNEDTEWNDILRAKGILPPREAEITEESIVNMIEQTIEDRQNPGTDCIAYDI